MGVRVAPSNDVQTRHILGTLPIVLIVFFLALLLTVLASYVSTMGSHAPEKMPIPVNEPPSSPEATQPMEPELPQIPNETDANTSVPLPPAANSTEPLPSTPVVDNPSSSSEPLPPTPPEPPAPTNDTNQTNVTNDIFLTPPSVPYVEIATATIGTVLGQAVDPSFIGFSFGWKNASDFILADGQGGAWPAFQTILTPFMSQGFTDPIFRLTGDSAWWNPDHSVPPSSAVPITIDIEPITLQSLAAIHNKTGVRYLLGLNLAANLTSVAKDEADAFRTYLPSDALYSFEIGNEPDLYVQNGDRPANYGLFSYRGEMDSFIAALSPNGSGMYDYSLSGACCKNTWMSVVGSMVQRYATHVNLATLHNYPLSVCSPPYPTPDQIIDAMLDEQTSAVPAKTFGNWSVNVTAAGKRLRLSEMNSVSCGGIQNYTDSFLAALWGADSMFEIAHAGIVGVNIHAGGTYATATKASDYAPFTITSQGVLTLRPLYFGMLLFAHTAGHGGQFLPVTMTNVNAHVKAFALQGSDQIVRIALIEKNLTGGGLVRLIPPIGSPTTARVIPLLAPSITDLRNTTFGGVPLNVTEGSLLADPNWYDVQADASGQFLIPLPPASAAVVILG